MCLSCLNRAKHVADHTTDHGPDHRVDSDQTTNPSTDQSKFGSDQTSDSPEHTEVRGAAAVGHGSIQSPDTNARRNHAVLRHGRVGTVRKHAERLRRWRDDTTNTMRNSRKALEGCGSDTCDRHRRYSAEGVGTVRKDAERSRRWHELTDTTGTVRKESEGVGRVPSWRERPASPVRCGRGRNCSEGC